jgi:hypothetical protein
MNGNLLAIVRQIIADNGEGILGDPPRLRAFFSDLAKDQPKPLRIAFGRCLEADAYTALKTASGDAERVSRKASIAQRLRDEHGLDTALCGEALDILEAALYGTPRSKPSVCKSCGRELQESWKVCPYCGAGANTAPAAQAQETAPSYAPQPVLSRPIQSGQANTIARKRHAFTTFWLIFSIIVSCFFGINFLPFFYEGYDMSMTGILSLCFVVQLIACCLLLAWKKIGFWLYTLVPGVLLLVTIILELLNGRDVNVVMYMLIPFFVVQGIFAAIMWGVLHLRKNGKTAWEQLEEIQAG